MLYNEGILLSVIIPTYNVEKYFKKCMDSVIGQTYKNLEIIIVDDGSTDDSGRIADWYAQRDKRITVIHKENGGLVSSRKAGIAIANGEYITHLDADDWIDENMYEVLIKKAVKTGAEIVSSGLIREYDGKSVVSYDDFAEGFYPRERIEKEIFPALIFTGDFYESGINAHVTNKIYRSYLAKKALLDVPNNVFASEDSAQVFPMFYWAHNAYIIHEAMLHYRCRELSNVTRKIEPEIILRQNEYMNSVFNGELAFKYQLSRLILYVCMLKGTDGLFSSILRVLLSDLRKGSRIVIYGAGKFGARLMQLMRSDYNIIAWMDQNEMPENGIESIRNIRQYDISGYDRVVIGALNYAVISDMKKSLLELSVPEDAIWEFDHEEITADGLIDLLKEALRNSC